MKATLLTLLALIATTTVGAIGRQPRTMQYHPDGRDIVCVNGQNRYTRALYGGYTEFRVETSDRPIFGLFRKNMHRNVSFTATVGGRRTNLESTDYCEARYNAGMRTYLLRDKSWGERAEMRVTVLAPVDTESAIWKFETRGFSGKVTIDAVLCGVVYPKMRNNGDLGAAPDNCFDAAADQPDKQSLSWKATATDYVMATLVDGTSYTFRKLNKKEGGAEYAKALKHHKWLAGQIVFDTPDNYINTLGGALVAAADGAWDGETWLHGAVIWRMPYNGWRAGFLGDFLGMPERAKRHFSAFAESQVTDVPATISHPTQDSTQGLSRAEKRWGTQMYSNGYICKNPHDKKTMKHYDMNLNYIDELLWHFQFDADTAYMRRMWQVLKLHLDWEKRNFDPDDDGLYDAYCCIWASDALYYNSGAVTHSSAYNYRALRLAAKIARILGEDPTYYEREADKTLRAMNSRLWLKDKGYWAEYQDFMGLKRTHTDAAVWTIYTPIDCDAATPLQAYRATQYIDSIIPHIPLVYSGENAKDVTPDERRGLSTISTSDWMPYDWSINNVAAEEVMHTALAYFEAGRADEGFGLLKANVLDQCFLGRSPGNFGQICYYDKARGELYRDFADNTGISSRTLIQGLFGITPQALDGKCVIRPGFPSSWTHASVRTPYLSYSFRREGGRDIYEIEQHFAQPLQIVIRQNNGASYVETVGNSDERQTIVVSHIEPSDSPAPLVTARRDDGTKWGNNFDGVDSRRLETVNIDKHFNSNVGDIFRNEYLTPRSPYTTLEMPIHGIGEWCRPYVATDIDDSGLRSLVHDGVLNVGIGSGISFRMPAEERDIIYTSLWDNYPDSVTIAVSGKASHAYLLMAGSTNWMQYRIDNAIVVAEYSDGTADTLHLQNPHNWCPIEQDFYEDGLAFHAESPRPYRIDLETGRVSRSLIPSGEMYGNRDFKHGAGIVLDMPLNPKKNLRSIRLRTLSNDVVVGLMAITLQRQ